MQSQDAEGIIGFADHAVAHQEIPDIGNRVSELITALAVFRAAVNSAVAAHQPIQRAPLGDDFIGTAFDDNGRGGQCFRIELFH
ncbi:MAG: hypothetical protein ACXWT1_22145 [Methylobacter sp.]